MTACLQGIDYSRDLRPEQSGPEPWAEQPDELLKHAIALVHKNVDVIFAPIQRLGHRRRFP
jgi:hypothetical protein